MRIERKNWRKNYFLFSWLCKLFLFLIVIISILSCRTLFKKRGFIPNNLSVYKTAGTFSGLFTFYDKQEKKYFTGDVLISKEGRMRIDLFASLSLPVFTFLFDKQKVTYLFLHNKKFYVSPSDNKPFFGFLPKNIKLSILKEVLFDRKPEDKRWKCEINEKKLPIKCQNEGWTIKWERKNKRLLSFHSAQRALIFEYFSFSSQVDESLFSIEIPKHFKPALLFK